MKLTKNWITKIDSHLRLYISIGTGIGIFFILGDLEKASIHWMASWLAFSGMFLFLSWMTIFGFHKWAFPLLLIGSNSILIYIASEGLVDFKYTANFVFGGVIKFFPLIWQPVFATLSVTVVQLLLLYFLYKRKWFLKV